MLKENMLQPYTFNRPPKGYCQHYILSVTPSTASNVESPVESSVLPHLNQLHRAASLPPNEHNTMTCAISRSVHARRTFDETVLCNAPSGPIMMREAAHRITPLLQEPGIVVLSYGELFFQPYSDKQAIVSVPVKSIKQIIKRRYLLQPVAIELFCQKLSTVPHLFLSFKTEAIRNGLAELLDRLLNDSTKELESVEESNQIDDESCESNDDARMKSNIEVSIEKLTYSWIAGAISNYDYLIELNSAGGRSANDLTQYPVFPWVLQDYSSTILDLTKPSVYRDLTKPIGALNKNRLQKLKARLRDLGTDSKDQQFLYGSHYSTPGFVLFFLVRAYPHLALCLHNGRFDHPDRMFNSIGDTYHNVTRNPSDFKELIPEFYDTSKKGEFLLNPPGVNLGLRQNGEKVGNVHLPPWAKDPRDLIVKFRAALESDYVSKMLHNWIDLIFGYKQRGQEAIRADNLFHPMCYEGAVDLSSVEDLNEREALEVQIAEFGQVPQQVFLHPHPQRNLSLGLFDALYLTSSCYHESNSYSIDTKTINKTLNNDVNESEGNSKPNCDNSSKNDLNIHIESCSCLVDTNICDKCFICKNCFFTSINNFIISKCCSKSMCSNMNVKKFLVYCFESYLCDDCCFNLFNLRTYSNNLNLNQKFQLENFSFNSGELNKNTNFTINENRPSSVTDETLSFSISKEKLLNPKSKRSSMIEIPKRSNEDQLNVSIPVFSVDDSVSYSPSKMQNSSKITELFSMIKSDFTSTLRKSKRERKRSSPLKSDCFCSLTLGEGHASLTPFIIGLLLELKPDQPDFRSITSKLLTEINSSSNMMLRSVKTLATNHCCTRPVNNLVFLPPYHVAALSAGPIVKILDLPSLKQVSSRRAGDFNTSSCLFFPSINNLLISSHDGFLYSYSLNSAEQNTTTDPKIVSENSPKRSLSRTSSPLKKGFSSSGTIKTEIKVSSAALTCMTWFDKHLYVGSIDGKVYVYYLPIRPSYNGHNTQSQFRKSCSYDIELDELVLLKRGIIHDFTCPYGPSDRNCNKFQQCCCYSIYEKNKFFETVESAENCDKVPSLQEDIQDLISSCDYKHQLEHNYPVSSLCVLPSTSGTNFLAVGLKNGEISVWNIFESKKPIGSIKSHSSTVTALCCFNRKDDYAPLFNESTETNIPAYTPTKDYELSSGNFGIDNTCDDVDPNDDWVLVNENIPRDPRIISRHSSSSSTLFAKTLVKPQYLLAAGSDGHVKLITLNNRQNEGIVECTLDWNVREPVNCMCWDGRQIILGGQSGDLIIKDLAATGSSVNRVMAHPGGVTSLCFSECGKVLVTGGGDQNVKLWGYSQPGDKLERL